MISTDIEIPTVQAVGTAVATTTTSEQLDGFARLGMWMAAAESGSKDPKAMGMAAAARIAYCDYLGLPPHAASEIHLINGNFTLSSKMLRALAHKHGLRVEKVDETPVSVTAAVIDKDGKELGRREFTMEMAKRRGLSGKNWTTMPERMLWARASKIVLDDCAPWVTVGVLLDDEAEQLDAAVPFDSDEVLTGEVVE